MIKKLSDLGWIITWTQDGRTDLKKNGAVISICDNTHKLTYRKGKHQINTHCNDAEKDLHFIF